MTLCAESLAGIADPLFPALRLARVVSPREAARAALGALLAPLESRGPDDVAPDWLLPHQAEAVQRARAVLSRFGGVLITDGVGLGKTHVGLALAALERRGGGDAVLVVPAAVRGEWQRAGATTGVRLRAWTHSGLARRTPPLDARCTLLIVDEAHAFRNPATRRYDALARLAAGRRVALLTATPYNNRPDDLAALIGLFAAYDRFREFGVPDIRTALRSRNGSRAALALGALAVCRTRRLVEQRFPETRLAFPRRHLLPPATWDLDAAYGGMLRQLLPLLEPPTADAERGAALLHLGMLRRLESSVPALRRTLLRQRAYFESRDLAGETGRHLSRATFRRLVPRSDSDDTQLTMWPVVSDLLAADPHHASAWHEAISRALDLLPPADAQQDPKATTLESLLDGPLAGRKTIVFTEHRDTARYLLRRLRRRYRVLAVFGADAWAGTSRLTRREALDAFAPGARGVRANPLLAADVLVATDIAGEGLNLQDASAVVNYDLPWNPVRVMQRIGRVDRLGSSHPDVCLAHLVPRGGMDVLTGVLRALRHKLEGGAMAPAAEPDPLAALWWTEGEVSAAALESESWRRVAPFEARERWRMLAGPAAPAPMGPLGTVPVIAAGVVPSADSLAGVLLAIEWRDGRRIPLPCVARQGGHVEIDTLAFAELAECLLTARPIPVTARDFTDVVAGALPVARDRLADYSAARHGAAPGIDGRRAAIAVLARHSAAARRERRDTAAIDEAFAALGGALPAGLDRALARLVAAHGATPAIAAEIADLVGRCAPPAGPPLVGRPKLVLVAALLAVGDCTG